MWSQADSTATNVLDAKVVQNNTTLTGDLNSAISAAQKLLTAASTLKLNPSGTVPALAGEQQALLGVLTTFAADLVKNPCGILKLGACFAAGTKLLTPLGWWPVEELYEGMLVRSRPEDDPHAETRWNAVEAKFVRTGRVLHLHVGGEVIRTTAEHPFYVFGQGWTAAGALQAGDWLSTMSGGWAAVEEVFDTGCYETVYNVRVTQDHTYFVGSEDSAFAIWAHNAECAVSIDKKGTQKKLGDLYTEIAKQIYQNLVSNYQGNTTLAVTQATVNGSTKYIVAIYGGAQFFAQLAAKIVAAYGSGFVPVEAGGVHAEQYLYMNYTGITAIGISNKDGPCPTCKTYFRGVGFYDVWWNKENLYLD